MLLIILSILLSIFAGCDLGDGSKHQKQNNTQASIPSFAVQPFDYVAVKSSALYADDFDCLTELARACRHFKSITFRCL
ncbi:MAG: hypothetical protein OYH77_08510 [Pseudomonadota bacterium]|nr:hypothetical protein [Pseudomonadota bacterium]